MGGVHFTASELMQFSIGQKHCTSPAMLLHIFYLIGQQGAYEQQERVPSSVNDVPHFSLYMHSMKIVILLHFIS